MHKIFILCLLLFANSFAVLEIPNAQPKVHAEEWKWVLDSTWQGLIRRNIEACKGKQIYNGHPNSSGLICRPKSETPFDAVSEGIGYGMLLALYANDQQTFDLIYNAGKEFGLNPCRGWRKPSNGGGTESGSATDADEDVAVALIFADKLVKKGKWNNTSTSASYANDAQEGINCVWGSISGASLLWPGNSWQPGYNIGYFAPAWYRVYKGFTNNQGQDWQRVIDASYTFIANNRNTGYSRGLVPDWSNGEGTPGGGGYNTYHNGTAFFKDAIRTLWRIANDVIWFPNAHPENSIGRTYLKNAVNFMKEKGGPDAANFYTLEGNLIPANDRWMEFNNQSDTSTWRWRREHSHLTVGQWLTAAMAVGTDEDKIAWSEKMAKFYDWDRKEDFFGISHAVRDSLYGDYAALCPNDPKCKEVYMEDTLHNEMYFDQFLAWFGVSLMSGTWVNIVDVLDNPVEDDPGIPGHPVPLLPKQKTVNMQITKSGNVLRMLAPSGKVVQWKIYDLQGKLLFSSKSNEASWKMTSVKPVVVTSQIGNVFESVIYSGL